MGIKSTSYITRENAIERIKKIDYLIFHRDFYSIEQTTFESNYSIKNFVDENAKCNDSGRPELTKWTDEMLSDQMDKPYYRFSMFDNYLIDSP